MVGLRPAANAESASARCAAGLSAAVAPVPASKHRSSSTKPAKTFGVRRMTLMVSISAGSEWTWTLVEVRWLTRCDAKSGTTCRSSGSTLLMPGKNRSLLRLAQGRDGSAIRPVHELAEISGRHGTDIDDRDPAPAPHPAGRLDAGHVGELQEPVGGDLDAEAPALGLAGLEVGE